MNEFISKFKNIKLKKKQIVLIAISFIIVVLIVFSDFLATSNEEQADISNTSEFSVQYIDKTEKELEKLLSNINGAGKVSVMITLENCYENVYAVGYSQSQKENNSQVDEEYIIVKKGSNNEECLLVKVYEPTVKGVAVIAEGAGSVEVKNAITQTVCALFNISSVKVSVEKMKN
ncbi:MAG: hypothetical protein ACI4IF_04935 [Acutalibacteraceae bacterium]